MIEGCGKSLAWFESWNWNRQSIPQQIASTTALPVDASTAAAPVAQPEKQGTFWGWLSCKFAGMNFTGGGAYDEYTGKCTIKGEFMRVLHGR